MPDRLGSRMPPDFVQKHLMVQGGAFRRNWEFKNEGTKWRYFFILNKSPVEDDRLLIVTATTKVQKTVRLFGPAVVVVNPREYASLEQESAINPAMPQEKTKQEIIDAITRRAIHVIVPLPESVLARVLKAVETVTTITPKNKVLILGQVDPEP